MRTGRRCVWALALVVGCNEVSSVDEADGAATQDAGATEPDAGPPSDGGVERDVGEDAEDAAPERFEDAGPGPRVGPSVAPAPEPSSYDFGAPISLTPTEVTRERLMAGGHLVLPPGRFEIDGQVTLTRPTMLVGGGRAAPDGTNGASTTELYIRLGSRTIEVDLARLDTVLNDPAAFVDDPSDPDDDDDDDAPRARIAECGIRIDSPHVVLRDFKLVVELLDPLDANLEGKGDTGTAITVGRFFAREQPRIHDVDVQRLTLARVGSSAAAITLIGNVDDVDIVDVAFPGWFSTTVIMHWGAENPTYEEASEAFLYDDYCISESFHPHNIHIEGLDVDRVRGLFVLSSSYDVVARDVAADVAGEILLSLPGDETNAYAGPLSKSRVMSNIDIRGVHVGELRFYSRERLSPVRVTSIGASRTHREGEDRGICPVPNVDGRPRARLEHSVDYAGFTLADVRIDEVSGERAPSGASDDNGMRYRYGLNLQEMRGTDIELRDIELSTIGREPYVEPTESARTLASFGVFLKDSAGIRLRRITSRARYGLGLYDSERISVTESTFLAPSTPGPDTYGAYVVGLGGADLREDIVREDIVLEDNQFEGFDVGHRNYEAEPGDCRRLRVRGHTYSGAGVVQSGEACLVEVGGAWRTPVTATLHAQESFAGVETPARGGFFEVGLAEAQLVTTSVAFHIGGSAALNRDYTLRVPPGFELRGTFPVYRVLVPPGEVRAPIIAEAIAGVQFVAEDPRAELSLVDGPSPYRYFDEDSRASLSLLEADALPEVNLESASTRVAEGGSSALRVTLDRAWSSPLTVWFRVSGTAAYNRDYQLRGAPGEPAIQGRFPDYRVAIPAGATRADLIVTALEDADSEPFEEIVVSLTAEGTSLHNVGPAATQAIGIEDAEGDFGGYDIIIVAGQSNAAGAGVEPDFEDTWGGGAVDMRIKQLGRVEGDLDAMPLRGVGYTSAPSARESALWDGLEHWDRIEQAQLGFGLTFARGYARTELTTGRQVLIIPAALGATTIEQWRQLPGEPPPRTRAGEAVHLRDDLLRRVDHVFSRIEGSHRVVALLWHQGEANVRSIAASLAADSSFDVDGAVDEYESQLERLLFEDFAAPLGEVPVIVGELSAAWTVVDLGALGVLDIAPIKTRLHTALATLAAESDAVGLASTSGLAPRVLASGVDPVHFSSASAVTLGRRYFAAWQGVASALRVTR